MGYNQNWKPKFVAPQEVHLIGLDGANLGIVSYEEAKRIAQEQNCDLVKISDKVLPHIYKLGDYGKIKYLEEKKRRKEQLKHKQDIEKIIRINFNESLHDLETKAKKATEFLEEGRRVRIEMRLTGREKMHTDISRNKFITFLGLIKVPFKYLKNISIMSGFCDATIIKDNLVK